MANRPPITLRHNDRRTGAEPRRAASNPVPARARTTVTTVTGTRHDVGGNAIANSGSSDPIVKAMKDATDACVGLVRLWGSIPSLSLIHISEPTRQAEISYAVFC